MAKAIHVQMFGDKKTLRKFSNLERNAQRKVLRPMVDRVAKQTVKPILKRELPARSFTPPLRHSGPGVGVGPVVRSHWSPPGSMRDNIKVKAVKRSRRTVGRVVMLPTRDTLEIPSGYSFYYPAAIEYGVKFNYVMGRPQPAKRIMRTVYQRHHSAIQAAVQKHAREAVNKEAKRA